MWRAGITFLAITAAFAGAEQIGFAAENKKADSVFLDEGDGDFDPVPSAQAKKLINGSDESTATTAAVPAEAEKPAQAAPMDGSAPADEQPAERPAHNPKIGKKTKAVPKTAPKTSRGDAGLYVTTKAVCPIRREPASESEQISATKTPRKIWVQKVDDQWVRAFVKSGEAGYISADCFE